MTLKKFAVTKVGSKFYVGQLVPEAKERTFKEIKDLAKQYADEVARTEVKLADLKSEKANLEALIVVAEEEEAAAAAAKAAAAAAAAATKETK